MRRNVIVDSIKDRVIGIVRKEFVVGETAISGNTSFANDLLAEPLDVMLLVEELEKEFHIEISEAELDSIETVGQAIAIVESHLQKTASVSTQS